ncbi:MAG TPA: ACP S-malonyltransferase [Bacteroidales bacterium]|nr:ACP S-malonyltransferase [Bacteroidales bacterium]
MHAYIFPGQGAQYSGMGKDLYESNEKAKQQFHQSNDILGFSITDIMFEGSDEDLKQTKVTQPAIFLHSVILAESIENFNPEMTAGHSLGEFSALVASGALSFEDGLQLVYKRAMAMQKACEINPSSMAAILGMENEIVEEICSSIDDIVVPANYNSTGQIVISGSDSGIDKAIEVLKEKGAKRAVKLPVGGAFHSPLMEPAKEELEKAIAATSFSKPRCPIYQNVNASPSTNPDTIRQNLVEQLVSPVKWTQTVINMVNDGATLFTEVGPGKVLQGLIKKTDRSVETESAS